MEPKLNVAKDCFVENVETFADPETQAEKFNLYNGLANLVEGVQELKKAIYQIQQAGLVEGVAQLKKELANVRKAGLVEGVEEIKKELIKIRHELGHTRVSVREELNQLRVMLDKARRR